MVLAVKKKKKKIHLTMQEMQEMWVQSLRQEDPLKKGMATHSSILAWGIPGRGAWQGYSPRGRKDGHN